MTLPDTPILPDTPCALTATQIHDGDALHKNAAIGIDGGQISDFWPDLSRIPAGLPRVDLGAGWLAPGFVDLQVNGGAGLMIEAATDLAALERICDAHAALGATAILPTLITDTPAATRKVIDTAIAAARAGLPGFAGLHLEGPHLDPARKGAHEAALIRPMAEEDLTLLQQAVPHLPALMVTLAPDAASAEQISRLVRAGVIVSLGHSGCSAAQARAAFDAGARCVTHLYNAMGGLQNRAPGLLGTALCADGVAAGLIADGIHVAPECLQVALRMKPEDKLFLVSDAMAVAGTDLDSFQLGTRTVLRDHGKLVLQDGTLAGADISLPESVARLIGLGVAPARALAMASRVPADILSASHRGRIRRGCQADLVFLNPEMRLVQVWRRGVPVLDPAF